MSSAVPGAAGAVRARCSAPLPPPSARRFPPPGPGPALLTRARQSVPASGNAPLREGRAGERNVPVWQRGRALLSCTRKEDEQRWDLRKPRSRVSRRASSRAAGWEETEEGLGAGGLQLSTSHGFASGMAGAQQTAVKEGQMFCLAFTSTGLSPVTHLLIAAVVCHIHLGSFLTDLK